MSVTSHYFWCKLMRISDNFSDSPDHPGMVLTCLHPSTVYWHAVSTDKSADWLFAWPSTVVQTSQQQQPHRHTGAPNSQARQLEKPYSTMMPTHHVWHTNYIVICPFSVYTPHNYLVFSPCRQCHHPCRHCHHKSFKAAGLSMIND